MRRADPAPPSRAVHAGGGAAARPGPGGSSGCSGCCRRPCRVRGVWGWAGRGCGGCPTCLPLPARCAWLQSRPLLAPLPCCARLWATHACCPTLWTRPQTQLPQSVSQSVIPQPPQATGVPLVDALMKMATVEAAAQHGLQLVATAAVGVVIGTLVLSAVEKVAGGRLREGAQGGQLNLPAAVLASVLHPAQVRCRWRDKGAGLRLRLLAAAAGTVAVACWAAAAGGTGSSCPAVPDPVAPSITPDHAGTASSLRPGLRCDCVVGSHAGTEGVG